MVNRKKVVLAVLVSCLSISGNLAFSQTAQDSGSKANAAESSKSTPKQVTKKPTQKSQAISTSGGKSHCSATSGDGKKSCSKSCADGLSASCSNDETSVECSCD